MCASPLCATRGPRTPGRIAQPHGRDCSRSAIVSARAQAGARWCPLPNVCRHHRQFVLLLAKLCQNLDSVKGTLAASYKFQRRSGLHPDWTQLLVRMTRMVQPRLPTDWHRQARRGPGHGQWSPYKRTSRLPFRGVGSAQRPRLEAMMRGAPGRSRRARSCGRYKSE